MSSINILILGINPEPWEAPGMAVGRGKGGRPYPIAVKSGRTEAYQEAIRESIMTAYPDIRPMDGSRRLSVTFAFWRQLDSYTKETGRTASRNVADATNMQKALEDALQGVVYGNDRMNKVVKSIIVAEGPDVEPCILVMVREDDGLDGKSFTAARDAMANEPRPPIPGNVYLIGDNQ